MEGCLSLGELAATSSCVSWSAGRPSPAPPRAPGLSPRWSPPGPALSPQAQQPCQICLQGCWARRGWLAPGLGPLPGHSCGAHSRLNKQARPWAGMSGCCLLPPAQTCCPDPHPSAGLLPFTPFTQPPAPHFHRGARWSGGGVQQTNSGPDTGRGTSWSGPSVPSRERWGVSRASPRLSGGSSHAGIGPTESLYLGHSPVLCCTPLVESGRTGKCVWGGASG